MVERGVPGMNLVTRFVLSCFFAVIAGILLLYMVFNIPKKYQTVGQVLRAPVVWVAVVLGLLSFVFGFSML